MKKITLFASLAAGVLFPLSVIAQEAAPAETLAPAPAAETAEAAPAPETAAAAPLSKAELFAELP